MDVEATYKSIRSIYQTLSGKGEADVSITYRGTNYGITEPWQARVGDRECNSKSHNGSLQQLFDMLKNELDAKASSAEAEAKRLRQAVNNLGN